MKTFSRSRWGILPAVLVLAALYCLAIGHIGAELLIDGESSRAALKGLFSSWYIPFVLCISACIAALSTFLVCSAGFFLAILMRSLTRLRRFTLFVSHLPLSIPYAVSAVAVFFLLSQGGWLSRIAVQSGITSSPQDFPVLVNDSFSVGVILAYLWKQVPFAILVLFSTLRSIHEPYDEVARSLGATYTQRLFRVQLPLLTPALISIAILCFTFTFSAYEIPALLGNTYPGMISVLTFRFYRDSNPLVIDQALLLSIFILLVNIIVVSLLLFVSKCVHSRKFRV